MPRESNGYSPRDMRCGGEDSELLTLILGRFFGSVVFLSEDLHEANKRAAGKAARIKERGETMGELVFICANKTKKNRIVNLDGGAVRRQPEMRS